jgi:Flp pilus assembly protein TadB
MAKQDSTVASLVNSVIADGQSLVKQQIELAKSELQYSAKQAAATSGMLVGAGVLAFLAFVFALVAGAYGLIQAGLAPWAGFLIVAGLLLLVAIVLGLLGRSRAKRVGPPQRALAQVQETKAALAARTPGSSTPASSPGTALVTSTPAGVDVAPTP